MTRPDPDAGAGDDADDPGSGDGFDDAAPLDLTPRTDPEPASPAVRRNRWRPRRVAAALVLAVAVGAALAVLLTGLDNATLYFRNADEALAQHEDLGDRRFRLQGTLQDDVRTEGRTVTFSVAFNGAGVEVTHHGDPPQMFRPGQAIVLEGHFAPGSAMFVSDRILVKHDAEYEAENPDRVAATPPGRRPLARFLASRAAAHRASCDRGDAPVALLSWTRTSVQVRRC